MAVKNLTEEKRLEYLSMIEQVRNNNKENIEVNKILNLFEKEINNRKYGLNWEQHIEQADIDKKNNLPIFINDSNRDMIFDSSKKVNFILEGDNLHCLSLLKKTHYGAIDLIIIDPPYNRGSNDFEYDDDFVDNNDRFKHSKWLSFMEKRLRLAKDLLNKDGYIFINIDDNEVAPLKMLCDEIFTNDNFVGMWMWEKTSTAPALSKQIRRKLEYILCYAKNLNPSHSFSQGLIDGGDAPLLNNGNPLKELTFRKGSVRFSIPDGIYENDDSLAIELLDKVIVKDGMNENEFRANGHWKWQQSTLDEEIENGTYFLVKSKLFSVRYQRIDITKLKIPQNFLNKDLDVGTNEEAANHIKEFELPGTFSYPKPVSLYKFLIKMVNLHKNITVLDFFAGSGTTAEAVLAVNDEDDGDRKFIICTNNQISARRKLDYLHDNNYLLDYNPGEKIKDVSIHEKIDEFLEQNSDINNKLFVDNINNYEEYGICKSVTYPRIKSLLTGKTAKGNDLSFKYDANLIYYRIELVNKSDEELIRKSIMDNINNLIQLDNDFAIDNQTLKVILNEEEIDNFTASGELKECKQLYVSSSILLTSEQIEIIRNNNITLNYIPDCYFKEELEEYE